MGTLNKALSFVNARFLMDRQPPTLYQTVAAEFMRQGYFAGHLRRMRLVYREQRDALAAELTRRVGDRVTLDVPDQGMHLVAHLGAQVSDVALMHVAREHGIVVRAISGWYRRTPRRSALMPGFTGFPRVAIVPAAGRLAEIIERAPGGTTQ